MRVGVRVHPVDHPAFEADVATIAGRAGQRLSHLMVPKVESLADVVQAAAALDAAGAARLPLHVLIESPLAVHNAFDIAAHPRVQSLSFGLMDFVSAHAGAIPADGMGAAGQFTHPLVVRAKLEIASAAHAHGKVPSHCVVTEFNDIDAMRAAARRAADEFGYTRMWSIHPNQIRPILEAFAPGRAADRNRDADRRRRRSAPTGRRSVSTARCTTAPATAISGRCSSARTPPAAPCPPRRRHGLPLPLTPDTPNPPKGNPP